MSTAYGKRPHVQRLDVGARTVAPTYGRMRMLTCSDKTDGIVVVDGAAERVATYLFSVDPSVRSFEPQPFSVDLFGKRLLMSKEAVNNARAKKAGNGGPLIYTPDFLVHLMDGRQLAIEVKDTAWPGEDTYWRRVQQAEPILNFHGYEFKRLLLPARAQTPLARNLTLLQQAARSPRPQYQEQVLEKLEATDQGEPVALATICAALGLSIHAAPGLLLRGVISTDIFSHLLTANTPTCLAYGDLTHLNLLERVQQ